jgi:hypothetical protein
MACLNLSWLDEFCFSLYDGDDNGGDDVNGAGGGETESGSFVVGMETGRVVVSGRSDLVVLSEVEVGVSGEERLSEEAMGESGREGSRSASKIASAWSIIYTKSYQTMRMKPNKMDHFIKDYE